ncbi:crossover junction endodeoxyribonuclease RuvC [Priestia aryabhattai]|uniref:crossover junction endodeoxyribonuclease RuvC n=1 Tax=Priestia aryabhattai TaxID=412384 RepID=UPI00399F301A
MSETFYLYGLDISLKCPGVAVYDIKAKEFVYIGSFNTDKIYATKENKGLEIHALKLKKIADWLRPIIKQYPPSLVAIERMFIHNKHKNEAPVIAKATGVVQVMFWSVPQFLYPPTTVKKEIIKGNAGKDVIAEEILKRYPDLEFANDDESDAVAVALCHLIQTGFIKWEK